MVAMALPAGMSTVPGAVATGGLAVTPVTGPVAVALTDSVTVATTVIPTTAC